MEIGSAVMTLTKYITVIYMSKSWIIFSEKCDIFLRFVISSHYFQQSGLGVVACVKDGNLSVVTD